MSFSEKLIESLITEAWNIEALAAWHRYVKDSVNQEADPIWLERQRESFLIGFMHASKMPPMAEVTTSQCIPMDPNSLIYLSRKIMPYIMAFGHHATIAPGDMMAALLIIITTIGRQMHPTFNNRRVFDVFGAEAKIILDALDKLQSAGNETQH